MARAYEELGESDHEDHNRHDRVMKLREHGGELREAVLVDYRSDVSYEA